MGHLLVHPIEMHEGSAVGPIEVGQKSESAY